MVTRDREELRKIYQREENTDDAVFIPARGKADIYDGSHIFRVCAYCRVSTDSSEQLSSYELQKQHYSQLAKSHSNWNLMAIFADEGISGTSLKKRDQFNEMIARCEAGEFDLIVTKSVSRFARNLVDCVSLIRRLKNQTPPIGVFFETDGLFTLSEESELKLSMLATFAQEESIKKSESMNWSLRERFKNKKLLTPELFGYRRPRDAVGNYIKYAKLEIYEPEAKVVRFIFDAFLAGFSAAGIAEILTDIGIPTKTGSMTWNEGSVGYILRNERYCGNVLTWKTFTADIFEHRKRKNRYDRDQYLYAGTHEAIVSVQKFEAVQTLLAERRQGMRGAYHIMQVIDAGVFRGYVPINHRWTGDDPDAYYEASCSVKIGKKAQKIEKAYFSAFDLSGYQVVRGQFLTARCELPCMTISREKITFNSSCTRKFHDVSFVQLLLHPTERKIALRPCLKDDAHSIPWQTRNDHSFMMKTLSCSHFCAALFEIMDWYPECRYKILGTWIARGSEQIIIFSLVNAMPSVVCEDFGEGSKSRKICMPVFSDEWGDSFGNEFYDFSIDNSLYYTSFRENWRISEKSRAVDGQQKFKIMTHDEVMDSAKKLKIRMDSDDE